jgi:hypothetical protein
MPEKVLARLDSHTVPASSWTDTEPYRGEIRCGAQKILKSPCAKRQSDGSPRVTSHGYDCNHPEVHLTPTGSDREAARTIISVGLSTGSLTEASWRPPRVVLRNPRLFSEMQWRSA